MLLALAAARAARAGAPRGLRLSARRALQATPAARHGSPEDETQPLVSVTFRDKHGEDTTVQARCGQTLLEVAHRHEIDLEGACESSLACSTCHVILSPGYFGKLEEATDEEEDMLDMAFGLKATSRLGCQVVVTPEIEGEVVQLPAATRNFYVDGHVPKPH